MSSGCRWCKGSGWIQGIAFSSWKCEECGFWSDPSTSKDETNPVREALDQAVKPIVDCVQDMKDDGTLESLKNTHVKVPFTSLLGFALQTGLKYGYKESLKREHVVNTSYKPCKESVGIADEKLLKEYNQYFNRVAKDTSGYRKLFGRGQQFGNYAGSGNATIAEVAQSKFQTKLTDLKRRRDKLRETMTPPTRLVNLLENYAEKIGDIIVEKRVPKTNAYRRAFSRHGSSFGKSDSLSFVLDRISDGVIYNKEFDLNTMFRIRLENTWERWRKQIHINLIDFLKTVSCEYRGFSCCEPYEDTCDVNGHLYLD